MLKDLDTGANKDGSASGGRIGPVLSVKAAAIRAAAANTIAAKTGSSATLDAIWAATAKEPASWRAKLDRDMQTAVEPEDTVKIEATNFRGAMTRGKQILDVTSKATGMNLDLNTITTLYHSPHRLVDTQIEIAKIDFYHHHNCSCMALSNGCISEQGC